MAQTLDQFLVEMRNDLEDFARSYRKSNEENPDHFPLTMKDGQEGLWLEFFLGHMSEVGGE